MHQRLPAFVLQGLHMPNLGLVVFLNTVPSVMMLLPIMSLRFLLRREAIIGGSSFDSGSIFKIFQSFFNICKISRSVLLNVVMNWILLDPIFSEGFKVCSLGILLALATCSRIFLICNP